MRCVHTLFASVLVLWSIPALSAESLNCRRASLADEIAICDRAQLRNLHNQMALLYVEVGKQVKDRTRFRQEQRLFISKRRACGGDSNCLKAVYNQRLAELSSMKHR